MARLNRQKQGPGPTSAKMKRKSVVLSYGSYALDGWEAEVVQFARTYERRWYWRKQGNEPPGNPRHRTLRQIRAECVAAVREQAARCEAHFAGVRRLKYPRSAERQAKRFNVPWYRVSRLLDRAQAAFGNMRAALRWSQSPALELGGNIPIGLAVTERGCWRVCRMLIRKQFAHLIGQNASMAVGGALIPAASAEASMKNYPDKQRHNL